MRFELAAHPKQYAACHRLMKEVGMRNERMGWPTILMYDDHSQLQGFMATEKRKDHVLGGPLCLKVPYFRTALRLINAYESWMAHCGIKFYWFHVLPDNTKWKYLVEKFASRFGGITKLGENSEGAWYQRDLFTKEETNESLS